MKNNIICFVVLCSLVVSVGAQKRQTREEYIKRYSSLAVDKMNSYGIPASITLAQGLLESDNGNSRLAREGNNHFGIKCHSTWSGKRIYANDDKSRECFRKYKSEEQSFDDHSLFLVNGKRYAFLFSYSSKNYKKWAHGLKKAGYATNPQYAHMLIKIIEDNELHRFDTGKSWQPGGNVTVSHGKPKSYLADIKRNNGRRFVFAKAGDTFASLSRMFGVLETDLIAWNEVPYGLSIYEGMIIYLKPKRSRAAKGYETHRVRAGENLWKISQIYCVKVNKLVKYNRFNRGVRVEEGDVIVLRTKLKRK